MSKFNVLSALISEALRVGIWPMNDAKTPEEVMQELRDTLLDINEQVQTLQAKADAENRDLFKKPTVYLSILISLIITSPYLYWLYNNNWSHFKLNSGYIKFFNIPTSSILFLGSIINAGIYPNINSFGREYMSLGMGILLIFGTIYTITKIKTSKLLKLMQALFWGIICISVLFFEGWPPNYNICIIPS